MGPSTSLIKVPMRELCFNDILYTGAANLYLDVVYPVARHIEVIAIGNTVGDAHGFELFRSPFCYFPFAIESPLPQDMRIFRRQRQAITVGYEPRRIVQRRTRPVRDKRSRA